MNILNGRGPIVSSIALSTIVFCASCGGSKTTAILNDINSPASRSEYANRAVVERELNAAVENRLDVIAPTAMNSARAHYAKGIELEANQGKPEQISDAYGAAHRSIIAAEKTAEDASDKMLPLLQARDNAIKLGAHEADKERFAQLEAALARSIRDIEGSSLTNRKEAVHSLPELQNDYVKLSLETSRKISLGKALDSFERAKKEGAAQRVPATFRETEKLLESAKQFIKQTYLEPAQSATRSAEAEQKVERLITINRQVKAWENLSHEQIALKMHSLVSDLEATSDESARIGNLPEYQAGTTFEEKTSRLNVIFAELNRRLSTDSSKSERLSSELATTQREAASLKIQATKGERLATNDKKFDELTNMFDSNEAEVSRKNRDVTIRLKQVKFPVGGSSIPTESFTSFKKVVEALNSYPNSTIMIQGHTDSTGSSELNRGLSEERARAVKEFLLVNGSFSDERIISKGFGSENPLASNKTREGRAMNRRIDIVIQPSN